MNLELQKKTRLKLAVENARKLLTELSVKAEPNKKKPKLDANGKPVRNAKGQIVDEDGNPTNSEWNEADHPRDASGKFASGSGSGSTKPATGLGNPPTPQELQEYRDKNNAIMARQGTGPGKISDAQAFKEQAALDAEFERKHPRNADGSFAASGKVPTKKEPTAPDPNRKLRNPDLPPPGAAMDYKLQIEREYKNKFPKQILDKLEFLDDRKGLSYSVSVVDESSVAVNVDYTTMLGRKLNRNVMISWNPKTKKWEHW